MSQASADNVPQRVSKPTVIDAHTHFFPQIERQAAARLDPVNGPWVRVTGTGRGMIMAGDRDFRPVSEACWNPGLRLEHMDRDGIDLQVICATPLLFAYDRPARAAADWAADLNDRALEYCARAHGRLIAMCQVPLQDTELACRELDRARRNGHVGVQIGNHVCGRNLDDREILAFLTHCANEQMPVFVHPWDMMARERMPRYMLSWLVAMPAETQLSILSLILSGAFEQLPLSLRICFAHGGGSFAFLLGRADNAWRHRDLVREDCPRPPSHYVDRFYCDSAVFDERSLRLLIEVMGEDRVMLGSDYPFPLGEQRVGTLVRESESLPAPVRTRILSDNATRFFGLDAVLGPKAIVLSD